MPSATQVPQSASFEADDGRDRGGLVTLLIACSIAVVALFSYQAMTGKTNAIRELELKSRHHAELFDARFDSTLRGIESDLQILARSVPVTALDKQATPVYWPEINATLASYVTEFGGVETIRIFDADGDLIYHSDKNPSRSNISDRAHFREARDITTTKVVISDVVVSRTNGKRSLFLTRGLHDGAGIFRGVVVASLDVGFLERLLQVVKLGERDTIAIYRSDRTTSVVQWPATTNNSQEGVPVEIDARARISNGVHSWTDQLQSPADSLKRTYSYKKVGESPFFVEVGLSTEDALASWRMTSLLVGVPAVLLLGLLAALSFRLIRVAAEARAASVSKSRFLAKISHEIRTPMNAILGMLGLLLKTELTARQADYATKTQGAARSLLGLLNDILDFSKIEAGKLTLDPQPFRIDRLLRDLGVILSANVGAKNIEVLFDIDPALPRELVGDAMRLQQVLINLSGNAIKFTTQGEVVLSFNVVSRDAVSVTVEIAVRDTGIGIAPENQARIFTGFTQAESSTTRRFGGTGLGVAISHRLVSLMGGELQLDSALGEGSRFHFRITLPVAAEGTEGAEGSVDVAESKLPPKLLCVLVVDDNRITCELLQRMGQSFGWTVDVAQSGEQALKMLQVKLSSGAGYDAVFVDWMMPGLDGWETSRLIRALPVQGKSPIIVMVTAHGQEVLAQRAEADQALLDGFLVKPVTASMLFDAVVDGLGGRGQSHPSRQEVKPGEKRLQGMRLLIAEDNLNNQQVARELLEDEGAVVQIANHGQEAVDAVMAENAQFDVVLMDLQMPVMDGFAAASLIRQKRGTQLPIVAMTANVMASDREACLAVGMNDHVGKPFDLDHLVSVLCKQAGRREAPVTVAPEVSLPAGVQDAATAAGVDLVAAVTRMGGNLALYQRMLRHFVKELSAMPSQLSALVVQGDAASITRLMHTVKGQAATLGAMALSAEAASGEKKFAAGPAPADAEDTARKFLCAVSTASAGLDTLLPVLQVADAPAVVSPAAFDGESVLRQLQIIQQHLQNADMAATDAMTELRRQPSGALENDIQAMDDVIGTLDFERALPLCNALIDRMKEGQPA